MARWWRHIMVAIAGFGAALPLRVQLDLGYGPTLPVTDGSALAKGGGNGGGKGNGNGNGGSKGNPNGGGTGGGAGRGTSAGGGFGRDNGGDTGTGKGNNAGGNSSKANSRSETSVGPSSGRDHSKVGPAGSGNTSGGRGQRARDKAPARTNKAPAKAVASARQAPDQAKAASRAPTARMANSVKTQPIGTGPLAEEIDRRPKPRQSTRFIVTSGLSQENLAKLTARGFRIEARTQGRIGPPVVRLRVPSGTSVAQARHRVRLVDAEASVDFDQFYYLDEAPPACTGTACKAASAIDWASLVNWPEARAPQCGSPPLIGLIDTGVNVEHAALKGQAVEIMPLPERHTVASQQDHGTAVAALLIGHPASQTPGLLPQARVVAVDAFYRDDGTADRTDVMTLVAAVEALAERGVRVMNMSLSGPSNVVLQKAIAAAQAKGIVIVAAAGNNGAGAEPAYPAAYPGVVAVTAIDRDLNVYRRATRGPYIDLSAPGVNVWTASAQGSGMLRTGTSYAVPFVSAAAGLVIASSPGLDAKAVQSRLEESARDLGQPGRDPTFGFGLIQMAGLCVRPAEPPAIAAVHEPLDVPPVGAQVITAP